MKFKGMAFLVVYKRAIRKVLSAKIVFPQFKLSGSRGSQQYVNCLFWLGSILYRLPCHLSHYRTKPITVSWPGWDPISSFPCCDHPSCVSGVLAHPVVMLQVAPWPPLMCNIKGGTAAWLTVIGNSHFINFIQLSILFYYSCGIWYGDTIIRGYRIHHDTGVTGNLITRKYYCGVHIS